MNDVQLFYDIEGNPVDVDVSISEKWQLRDSRFGIETSTVFLGIDYGLGRDIPMIFETMFFVDDERLPTVFPANGNHLSFVARYSTKEQAIEGHRKGMEFISGAMILVDGEWICGYDETYPVQ